MKSKFKKFEHIRRGWDQGPVNARSHREQTHTTENITFLQTTYARVKYVRNTSFTLTETDSDTDFKLDGYIVLSKTVLSNLSPCPSSAVQMSYKRETVAQLNGKCSGP